MYLPYWVSAALAVFNSASKTDQPVGTEGNLPVGTKGNLIHRDGEDSYYLSVDEVKEYAVPHLVKFEGDKPPAGKGVWLFSGTKMGFFFNKLFVPGTDLCLAARIDNGEDPDGPTYLAKCYPEIPTGMDTWLTALHGEQPGWFNLFQNEDYVLTPNGTDVIVEIPPSRMEYWEINYLEKAP